MKNQAIPNSGDRIVVAATKMAQAQGYGGLSIRDLAQAVGIKAAARRQDHPDLKMNSQR